MKRSWLLWLGLLGFLGLLAPLTGNAGFAGFFGFYGFFAFHSIRSDERLEATIGLAARNAFVCSMVLFAATPLAAAVIPGDARQIVLYAYATSFAVQMLVFTVSLVYYDRLGEAA